MEDEQAAIEELGERVRVFRLSRCFDNSKTKLIMHLSCPDRRKVMKDSLSQLGVTWTLSKAPPGAMEDELEKYLAAIEHK